MTMKKRLYTAILAGMAALSVSAQQYVGFEGLIHLPSADMDTVGVARIGAHYMPKRMMPEQMTLDGERFNSLTNYISVTPFRWIEIGYGYTLWKVHKDRNPQNETGFFTKDRYFSVKLQVVRESEWWPSVAVGGNDVWGSSDHGESRSNYMKNFYGALSKHVELGGNILGGHVVYRQWNRDYNHKWNGLLGGVTFQPAFYTPLRVVGEWDGNGVNIGADCRLFRYFLLQCSLQEMRSFTAGLSFNIQLL